MLSLRQKKQVFSQLKQLQRLSDEISIPLDAETNKSKILDRIAIIVGAMAANTGLLCDVFEEEIMLDENRWRMEQEFKRLYEQEMYRLKPPPDLPANIKPEDEDEPGGLAKGM